MIPNDLNCNKIFTSLLGVSQGYVQSSCMSSRLKITHFPLQPGQLLVQVAEPAPARGVEGVEEVGHPLDRAAHQLDVLPVHPVRLGLQLQGLSQELGLGLLL